MTTTPIKSDTNEREQIEDLLNEVREKSEEQTRGKWLEDVICRAAPLIKDWQIEGCYSWGDWPQRKEIFPKTTKRDFGIDLVAVRSDGKYIAIQCKSRQLDEYGAGNNISKEEIDSFAAGSAGELWAERWLVSNGEVPVGPVVKEQISTYDKPIKQINSELALQLELGYRSEEEDEPCEHCAASNTDGKDGGIGKGDGEQADGSDQSEPVTPVQSRSCMQREAVTQSVERLREHAEENENKRARGKIVLPCGTGKTRISLRIVEELTPKGGLSVVLCPSIALVAQLRREYLHRRLKPIEALAVCSDKSAGYDPSKEDDEERALDPTADTSNVSTEEVNGLVTTDSSEIADWVISHSDSETINVIFGTYQSGQKIAEALKKCPTGTEISVLVADEAHRTAGLRSARKENDCKKADEKRLREFALCHDDTAFPAKYRVYQTATPRIYDVHGNKKKKGNKSKDFEDWVVRSMDDQDIFGIELYRKSYVEAVENKWLADYRIIAFGINDKEAYDLANRFARKQPAKGRNLPTTNHFMRALAFALVMAGATQSKHTKGLPVKIKSCIAFLNTVKKSKTMTQVLEEKPVRDWLAQWFKDNSPDATASDYRLQHVDASSNVTKRDNAKSNLRQATHSDDAKPHGVLNVGIFGEGTDSPSLSAVAFLEPRKSPVDVVQAVGRAMRTAPNKEVGYVVVPIVFPPNVDPEQWLASSDESDWNEMGEILCALRAHDKRIEDELSKLMMIRFPKEPEKVDTLVVIGGDDGEVEWYTHTGLPGLAEEDACKKLRGGGASSTAEASRYQ